MPAKPTTKELGDELELRVAALLRRLGKRRVQHNVGLVDQFGNRSQIDVQYGLLFKRYVECKNYTSGLSVPLSDVAKFKEVLLQNGIPASRGVFVTTSTFTPRALRAGITTVDGKQLIEWERRSFRVARWRWARRACLACAMGVAAAYFVQHPAEWRQLQCGVRQYWPVWVQSTQELWDSTRRRLDGK